MKIRNDFVSNSSSSSFIVICHDAMTDETSKIKQSYESSSYVFPNIDYKTKFGWEFADTHSFEGKLNFIGLQLLYIRTMELDNDNTRSSYCGRFDELYDMTKNVCREQFGLDVELDFSMIKYGEYEYEGKNISYHDVDMYKGYIDHQSCVAENSCMEMFDSESNLINFLCNSESFVQAGNDNV